MFRIIGNAMLMLSFGLSGFASAQAEQEQVTYEDVRPIFARHCIGCHRGLTPRGKLNLSRFPFLKDGIEADQFGIVERVLKRVTDEEKPMPPANATAKPLSEEQIALIEQWLDDGLPYEE